MVPTSNYVQGMAKAGWLQPIDKQAAEPQNLMPAYMDTPFDPGNRFSVPYAYTITMIGYNEQKMKELGINVDSWSAIFDPKILEKVKGRVTVLDSQSELMAAALKYLSYSVNDRDPKHWEEGEEGHPQGQAILGRVRGLRATSSSSLPGTSGWRTDIPPTSTRPISARRAKQKFRIKHALPKEGAVLALDVMVLQRCAAADLAYQFINFMLEGRNSADLTNMIGSGNPNSAAMAHIKPEIKSMSAIFPDEQTAKKLEMLEDLTAKERRVMNRIWTEIKAK